MDNACHTLCALALLRACGQPPGARATVAVVVAANLPDVDGVVAVWGGMPAYLESHRGITHSVLGLVAQCLLVAAACWRWPARTTPRPPFLPLLAASALGAGSHLLLDALNAYGIRPWLPFHDRWLYFDVAFIIDPFLWLGFGAAAAVGTAPGLARALGWGAWTLAATVFQFLFVADGLPTAVPLLFAGGMLMALLVPRRCCSRLAVAFALAATGGYVAMLAWCGHKAEARALAAVAAGGLEPERIVGTARMARPGHPFAFEVMVATATSVQPVAVDLWRDVVAVSPPLPRNLDEPLLQRVRLGRELRAWRTFARLPVVERASGGSLRLGDARFRVFGRPDWSALEVPVPR